VENWQIANRNSGTASTHTTHDSSYTITREGHTVAGPIRLTGTADQIRWQPVNGTAGQRNNN